MKVVLGLVAGLGLAGVVYLGVMEAQRAKLVPDGTSAPELELARHDGGTLKLSELRGQVVMLDFWATWCPPCREEMPALVKLAKEYEPQGLVFVAASRDDGPKADRLVESFLKRTLPDLRPYVVYANDDVARTFQVTALPTLYFLDREGKVMDAQRGALSEDALRRRIERALKQQ
ncbi:TlpA disulfide reductase family protein [Myxococcus sp. RHSTA-1-4]|uniref:TlpA family protein disulfide reductase n=1 Tax=Myxococcus sp. RHSTA-1-4 TaxID=2874601 RepID=UPI001CBAFC91|nr:TlpA disulfide reductase family protein [Myxococcus sp. RHSTA-1-4]MBZ4418297.1 TlpA family protein disulfide reductase [Myxococcus sp. RHSTA-1-4]